MTNQRRIQVKSSWLEAFGAHRCQRNNNNIRWVITANAWGFSCRVFL